MDFRKRVAFAAALAILAAAALGATTDRSAAEHDARGRRHQGRPPRRVRRLPRSAPVRQVAGHALRRAVRARRAGRTSSTTLPRRGAREAAPPKQGVDFSGTNVQEEGVDEPDIVKTDGNTLYAVANGKLNAVDVRTAKPQLLDTLKLDPGRSYELLLHGDRLLAPLARRLLGRAAARDGRADDAVRARAVRSDRDRRVQADRRCASSAR